LEGFLQDETEVVREVTKMVRDPLHLPAQLSKGANCTFDRKG